jgi:hypothetical protein
VDADPFTVPPGFCPKCVAARREDVEACAACGLVYANFLAEEHLPSEALATEWRALGGQWEDWDAHERVLMLALGRGELAMAGRLYRIRLAQAPGDALAQRGRDEVVRRATSASTVGLEQAVVSPVTVRRVKTVVTGVVLLAALVLAVLAFRMLGASLE